MQWYDYLSLRVIERFNGMDELSIEQGDMEDLLKKNEYLDIRDYIEGVNARQQAADAKSAEIASRLKGKK